MKISKKASLELSINAIVIVVLAFVMLGLALGFIKSQFKNFGGLAEGVQSDVKEKLMEDLRSGNNKLSFPTREITVERNQPFSTGIGVKNLDSGPLKFGFVVYTQKAEDAEMGKCTLEADSADATFKLKMDDLEASLKTALDCDPPLNDKKPVSAQINYFYDTESQSLSPTDSDVYPLRITATGTPGTYQTKIIVVYEDEDGTAKVVKQYAAKSFYIQVV